MSSDHDLAAEPLDDVDERILGAIADVLKAQSTTPQTMESTV